MFRAWHFITLVVVVVGVTAVFYLMSDHQAQQSAAPTAPAATEAAAPAAAPAEAAPADAAPAAPADAGGDPGLIPSNE